VELPRNISNASGKPLTIERNKLKIPVNLIIGFLGSGKTTFLDRILEKYDTKYRFGIIQNEFAPANVDGQELKSHGHHFEILEINNGSIFCLCLMEDFTRSLSAFAREKKPDMILIEASGLSDPVSVVEIMQNPLLSDKIYLSKIWCVVDALNFLKVEKMMNRLKHQVLLADEILINKTDLATKDQIIRVREYIGNINSSARMFQTNYCRSDFSMMEKEARMLPLAILHREEFQLIPFARPEIRTGVFKSGRRIRYRELKDLIHSTVLSTLRIKGNVLLSEGQTALVQTVFEDIRIKITDDHYGTTCLVFLGENFNLSTFSRTFRELAG
jgi:G3E family GTPase